jgi:thiamine-monophosphate kinase
VKSRLSEFERIERIARILSKAGSFRDVEVGIGDDAAVIRARGRLVWTIDAQVEGVHFDPRWLTWEDVGYRSFQAAVSDLAAMGAEAVAAVANLSLPASFSERALEALVRGQARAARGCGCPLIGGNLSKSAEVSIATSALGRVQKALLRSGARPRDELWLVGDVGMAGLGLGVLSGRLPRSRARAVQRCVERWRRPRALLAEGRALVGAARAALDVSDGLAGDAAHLAEASRVRVVIDAEGLRAALSPDLLDAARAVRGEALELALYGGEDYALLAAGPARRRSRGARAIGHIEEGRGVWLRSADGTLQRLRAGYDHFETTR